MSRIVDNLIAYKILSLLVTRFEDTPAYKLGIIDNKGHNLKRANTLETSEEKDAYSYLHRLVFNMKKLINKLPGGENRLKSLVAALFLIKEYYEKNDKQFSLMETRFNSIMNLDITLIEESIIVEKYLKDNDIEEDAPANATGAAVSTDRAVIKQKDLQKYIRKNKGALAILKRVKPVV